MTIQLPLERFKQPLLECLEETFSARRICRQRLKTSHQRVVDTINSLDTWEGEYDLAGTLAILTHTAYHLGGIRQALGVVRARNKTSQVDA